MTSWYVIPLFIQDNALQMPECSFNDSRIDEGISLFNAGEFFACHDVWEDFWGELTCPEKPFFQGLIQAAVALFHFEEGNLGGARRMASSCGMYLSPFAPTCGRIDVARLLTDLDACFGELLQEHASYPFHLKIDPNKVPKIFRSSQTNSRGG
ncbi:MAG: DUF309 domain-containing protein [Planctomycetales bacterium]|nr:DUF309 domain-containing protein [Planctomycetales bacterium]